MTSKARKDTSLPENIADMNHDQLVYVSASSKSEAERNAAQAELLRRSGNLIEETPNSDSDTRSTGVRGVLSREGYDKLSRYEEVTGLSRSDLLDLAVKTLDTVDIDYLMALIRQQTESKVSTIERMLRSR